MTTANESLALKEFLLNWAMSDATFDRRPWEGLSKSDKRRHLERAIAGLYSNRTILFHAAGQNTDAAIWAMDILVYGLDTLVTEILDGDMK